MATTNPALWNELQHNCGDKRYWLWGDKHQAFGGDAVPPSIPTDNTLQQWICVPITACQSESHSLPSRGIWWPGKPHTAYMALQKPYKAFWRLKNLYFWFSDNNRKWWFTAPRRYYKAFGGPGRPHNSVSMINEWRKRGGILTTDALLQHHMLISFPIQSITMICPLHSKAQPINSSGSSVGSLYGYALFIHRIVCTGLLK